MTNVHFLYPVGHVNEKNFVGLATDGDYITCGGENNGLYVYYKGRIKLNINFCVCTMSHQTYSDILCGTLMVGLLPFMNCLVQQSMMRQEGVDNLSQVFQILKCTHSFFKIVSRTFQKVFTVSRSDFYDLSFYNYSHSLSYLDLLT